MAARPLHGHAPSAQGGQSPSRPSKPAPDSRGDGRVRQGLQTFRGTGVNEVESLVDTHKNPKPNKEFPDSYTA